jgi:hypothetical protein
VLGGFAALHMLSLAGQDTAPSTTVVVLGHGGIPAKDYAGRAETSLVSALATGGGHVVVAGNKDSADQGGLVSLVRSSRTLHGGVSTVDNADNGFGQVSAVLALAGANKGLIGHYGTEQGADALYPAPPK